jgi:hypothetical protein
MSTKRAIYAKLPERSIEQLDELTRRFGTKTTALSIALDRAYREETHAMDERITHIKIEYSSAAMWGNVDPVEDGWNEDESLDAFESILDGFLTEDYPDAEIVITRGINDAVTVNHRPGHESQWMVDDIVNKAWSSDWMVAL